MRLEQKISSVITFVLLAALCAAAPVLAQEGAQVGVFADLEIPLETRVEVPVEVRGVVDLYALDLTIRFDPEILQVEDADPNQAGVQPGLATFLDAGMTLFNSVDNETGTVRFVMSQINPSEPKSGDGILLVLYFVGKQAGTSELTVEKIEFSTRFGEAIAVSGVDAEIVVSAGAPEVVSTPIPVQDQGQIIVIETLMPTEVPTESAVVEEAPAAEPTVIASVEEEPAQQTVEQTDDPAGNGQDSEAAREGEKDGKTGLWIGGIILAVALAAAGYLLFHKNQRSDEKEE